MSNPWKDYLQNFRDNLPTGVTYRGDIARYIFNEKRFILPNDVVRYKNYLEKLGFSAFDPDAAAYIAAVEAEDGEPLEAGVREAYDAFVKGCKADAIWDAIKASCILAGARTLNGCLVPLVGPTPTSFNFVSDDYDRITGLSSQSGASKHIDSNRLQNASPATNAHMSVFYRSGSGVFIGGGSDFNNRITNNNMRINNSGFGGFSYTSTLGLVGASRSSSDGFSVINGGVLGFSGDPSGSTSEVNIGVFGQIIGDDFDGTGSDLNLSFYSIGEALDLAALDARVSNLMEDLTFTFNTGLSPADYDRDTINYVNAGYAAGGTLA